MRRAIAVVGPVRPAEAWERYAEIARWPTWAPPIRRVSASAARLRTGVSGVVHGPAGLRIRFQVVEVREPVRSWSWRVRCGPARMGLQHEVLASPSGQTVATLTVQGPAVLVLGYLPIARLALLRLVRPSNDEDSAPDNSSAT